MFSVFWPNWITLLLPLVDLAYLCFHGDSVKEFKLVCEFLGYNNSLGLVQFLRQIPYALVSGVIQWLPYATEMNGG